MVPSLLWVQSGQGPGPRTQDPGPRTQGRAHPGGCGGRIQDGGGLLQKADVIGHGEERIVVPQEPGGGRESEGGWGVGGSQRVGGVGAGLRGWQGHQASLPLLVSAAQPQTPKA